MSSLCSDIYYCISQLLSTNSDIISLLSTCKDARQVFWKSIRIQKELRLIKYIENDYPEKDIDIVLNELSTKNASYHEALSIAIMAENKSLANKIYYGYCQKDLSYLAYVYKDTTILEDLLNRNADIIKNVRSIIDDQYRIVTIFGYILHSMDWYSETYQLLKKYTHKELFVRILSMYKSTKEYNHIPEIVDLVSDINDPDVIRLCYYDVCRNNNYPVMSYMLDTLYERYNENLKNLVVEGFCWLLMVNDNYAPISYLLNYIYYKDRKNFKAYISAIFSIWEVRNNNKNISYIVDWLASKRLDEIIIYSLHCWIDNDSDILLMMLQKPKNPAILGRITIDRPFKCKQWDIVRKILNIPGIINYVTFSDHFKINWEKISKNIPYDIIRLMKYKLKVKISSVGTLLIDY